MDKGRPVFKECSETEFFDFITAYPRNDLTRNVNRIGEPPMIEYHDFRRGISPQSIVACYFADGGYDPALGPHGWKIRI